MVFKDYKYERPDIEEVKSGIAAACAKVTDAKCADDVIAAINDLEIIKRNFETQSTLANIRYTLNTADEFYAGEQAFMDENSPLINDALTRFSKAILSSPYCDDIAAKFGRQFITNAEIAVKSMTPELIPLMQQENKLVSEYQTLAASVKVEFNGEICNGYGLLKHMQDPDRAVRKAAYDAWAGWFTENEDKLGDIYDKLVKLRHEKGKLMGYENFIPLGYLGMSRVDYGPKDVAKFREAVVKYIVPVCTELRERQAKRLGLDNVKFYDETFMFNSGNAVPQHPLPELIKAAQKMYHELSPETGEFFDFMVEHELLELDTRPGKAVGGYCTFIPQYDSPFIFSNSNGTMADIGTLTHEAGHAFESYSASRVQPLLEYFWSTLETCEIHSMSMEYFTYPWMDKFFGPLTDKYYFAHLSDALTFIPYGCCVDEYQHIVYEHPEYTPAERTAVWHELEKKYLPHRDYDGKDIFERGGFWMQKLHIFCSPFYYIDYTLASMGAFEYYGKSLIDREAAWNDYCNLCRAGGSHSYMELLKIGNLSSPFEDGTVEKAIKPLVDKLNSIDDSVM